MSNKNTGSPAYPCQEIIANSIQVRMIDTGMTLRDYFAGQALAGLVGKGGITLTYDIIPKMSYNIADAMISERDKS
jgi:hypothetical protein